MSNQLTHVGNEPFRRASGEVITADTWKAETDDLARHAIALHDHFDRAQAVEVGAQLAERDGVLKHEAEQIYRQRTVNWLLVACLADAYLNALGHAGWYDAWIVDQPSYPFSRQTLYNRAQTWRDDGLQRMYTDGTLPPLGPSVMREIVRVKDPEAREALMVAAETGELRPEQVSRAASIMVRDGLREVPNVPRRGDRADLPDAQPLALILYSLAMEGINKGMKHMLDELEDESGFPVQWANEVKDRLGKAMQEAGYVV